MNVSETSVLPSLRVKIPGEKNNIASLYNFNFRRTVDNRKFE